MLPLATRDAPARGFDIAGVERLREHALHILEEHLAGLGLGEGGLGIEEALHLALRAEPSAGIAFEGLLDDRGQWLVPHEDPPMAPRSLIAITARRLRHDCIAPLKPRRHLLDHLPSVLLALELALRGDDGLDELAFGRVLEAEVEAFGLGPVFVEGAAELLVELDIAGEALQVVEDDDEVGLAAGFEIGEERYHAGTVHEVAAARSIVREDCLDLVAAGLGILPATMLLALEPGALGGLLLAGDPAVDDGLGGGAGHGAQSGRAALQEGGGFVHGVSLSATRSGAAFGVGLLSDGSEHSTASSTDGTPLGSVSPSCPQLCWTGWS
ncbi:MAG: hypothetical protein AAFP17_07910 [Pseudomonadota bacterium]